MISCVLCGGLSGEVVFLASLKWVLKFWEENILKKGQPHIMVTLQGHVYFGR